MRSAHDHRPPASKGGGPPGLFAPLKLDRRSARLACERCLKSELIYLRQGLLRQNSSSKMWEMFRRGAMRPLPALRGMWFPGDKAASAAADGEPREEVSEGGKPAFRTL